MSLLHGLQVSTTQAASSSAIEEDGSDTILEKIPEEILLIIFSYIPKEQYHHMALVCHTFKRLIYDTSLFHYQDEICLSRMFLNLILREEPKELEGALRFQRIKQKAEGNRLMVLKGRASYLKAIIYECSMEKLARIDMDRFHSHLRAFHMKRYIEYQLVRRWKYIIKENTDPNGCLLIPWYLRFSYYSFTIFLQAMEDAVQVNTVVINMPMNTELTDLLTSFVNQPDFPASHILLDPCE